MVGILDTQTNIDMITVCSFHCQRYFGLALDIIVKHFTFWSNLIFWSSTAAYTMKNEYFVTQELTNKRDMDMISIKYCVVECLGIYCTLTHKVLISNLSITPMYLIRSIPALIEYRSWTGFLKIFNIQGHIILYHTPKSGHVS